MLATILQTAAALMVLNVAPPPVRHLDSAAAATAHGFETGWMIQPDQARRFLTLHPRSHLTESLGCMIAKSFAGPCSLRGFLEANEFFCVQADWTPSACWRSGSGGWKCKPPPIGSRRPNDQRGHMQLPYRETGEIIFEVSGTSLEGRQLRGARLHHAALRGEDLTVADLRGADLCIADLSGATLSGANLTGADLSGATLTGAKLDGAFLLDAKLLGVNLANASLRRADLTRATLRFAEASGADFTDAIMPRADLSYGAFGSASFSGAQLDEASLNFANFAGAKLPYASLVCAVLIQTHLRDADLRD